MAFDQRPVIESGENSNSSQGSAFGLDIADLTRLVDELEDAEKSNENAPLSGSILIERCLRDPSGRAAIIDFLEQRRAKKPISDIATYLSVLANALDGRLKQAQAISEDSLVNSLVQYGAGSKQFLFASRLSRALKFFEGEGLDYDARERLHLEALQSDLDPFKFRPFEAAIRLFRREDISPLEKEQKSALALREAFAQAEGFDEKLRIAQAALDEQDSRLASFAGRVEMVREFYFEMRPIWVRIIQDAFFDWKPPAKQAVKIAEKLIRIHRLALILEESYDASVIQKALVDISATKWGAGCCSIVASLLIEIDPERWADLARTLAVRTNPETANEESCWHYFNWALRANEYLLAARFFAKLSPAKQRKPWRRVFAQLAARNQDFDRAARESRTAHASELCRPSELNPLVALDNFLTSSDCQHLLNLKVFFEQYPKATAVSGVVFLTDRSVSEISRISIDGLLQLRKLGWVFVPLVAGVFPIETTGIPELDHMAGRFDQKFHVLGAESAKGASPEASAWKEKKIEIEIDGEEWASVERRAAQPREPKSLSPTQVYELVRNRIVQLRLITAPAPNCPLYSRWVAESTSEMARFESVLEAINKTRLETSEKIALVCARSESWVGPLANAFCRDVNEPSNFFGVLSGSSVVRLFHELPYDLLLGDDFSRADVTTFELDAIGEGASIEQNERFVYGFSDVSERPTDSQIPTSVYRAKTMISDWRANGGRVVCLFQRKPSCGVQSADRTGIFDSEDEWVNESLRMTEGSETLILLRPTDFANSSIEDSASQETIRLDRGVFSGANSLVIDPQWFRLPDLAKLIDLGVSLDGTVALELAMLKVPQCHMSVPNLIGLDLGTLVVGSKRQYRGLLRSKKSRSEYLFAEDQIGEWCRNCFSRGGFMKNDTSRAPLYGMEQLVNSLEQDPAIRSRTKTMNIDSVFGRIGDG